MIKKIKVKIDKEKAEKTLAWKKDSSTYDDIKKEFSFDVYAKTGTDFALIHDEIKAMIIKGTENNITEAIHNIEEFKTEKECLDRIKELGLIYEQPETIEDI